MVFLREPAFSNILIVAFSRMIGWIAIEKAHRPVILPNELFKVLVLNYYLCQTTMRLLDKRKVSAHIMGLAAKAVEAAGIGIPNKLIKPCCLLHIIFRAITSERISH